MKTHKHAVSFLEQDAGTCPGSDLHRRAFTSAGITHFNNNFLGLLIHDIEDITIPPCINHSEPCRLQLTTCRCTQTTLASHHFLSNRESLAINILSSQKVQFDPFRTQMCNPQKPIVPWSAASSDDDAIAQRRKNEKPSKWCCKVFKDPVLWVTARDRFLTTLEAQSLPHLPQEGHSPVDLPLCKAQQAWPRKVMQDTSKNWLPSPSSRPTLATRRRTSSGRRLLITMDSQ